MGKGIADVMKASAGQTLHQRILSDIEGRIVSGEWPPGHRLPFEVDLADQYHCSRMTVNKVMGQLAKAGLIERRKKSGSFVRQPQIQSAVLQIHDIGAEVESLGLEYGFKILEREGRSAKSGDRERLDVSVGTSLLEILCIHFAGAREFCVEQRLISLTAVPEAAETDFTEIAPGPGYLAMFRGALPNIGSAPRRRRRRSRACSVSPTGRPVLWSSVVPGAIPVP